MSFCLSLTYSISKILIQSCCLQTISKSNTLSTSFTCGSTQGKIKRYNRSESKHSTCFLLTGMNNGYAIYVSRDGNEPTIPVCSQIDFLNWDKHSKCFIHTLDTHSRRQWLWRTYVHHKLRDCFNAKSCGLPGIQLIKQTLSEGHSAVLGLQIYTLFAVSDIDVSEKDLIKHVVWYNDHCAAANEKFAGVAVNNEAYASIKCHSGQSEQTRYLQHLNMSKTEAMKQIHGHLLTHWQWGPCGSAQKLITYNRKTQDVVQTHD
ncbi:unnamed protein product [Mytilus coruscus]|uniref:Uncharacterized protein n=1 Tax=Mytilus coruscus TaxID=42192 RepID=A0A6J8BZE4_MYTCO|nr:unnamed protein product [Mytilus coruscus]